ncbi:MAG: ribonuclease Y [Candidatus Sungbacteria bacterium RIFCSPLOWO2_02_FULL_51_17]|uniref:Ribonuclease Y n=1 Tax=Candidatus Sungbacteria bacterium RIFCSPHIGHO2_02_FULL_51_29 TaxID=1802273 RepID=A0A1G2KU82_9BACT|nr:MAG: ribonuclease Y [Candidatus Sungbacteria bacterium RIFCSPHIGHO2_01_FULL_51_22]OHA01969.1 MAG: ribonuclease Y [Candidatus Sungbacteria bacterium RIFCSPHIGHO2_02_FULL_51_29]OHA05086.1 MAG: ribonuclease Y [Candidatus Sungbacteria bacterium RIFCSPLOWO2_01_FULL_51_34]OHA11155.1 MAG: ribonuclease Y [Candidatus Sungbacteria bacterium RIFCSPLOWO2_02_FULL_51_17]
MNVFVFIGGGVVLLFVGGIGGYFLRQAIMQQRKNSIEAKLKKLVEDSRQEAKQILIDAKTKSVSILEEAKEEEREREAGLRKNEERLEKREVSFEKQMTDFESRRLELNERVEKVKIIKEDLEAAKTKTLLEIERIAGLSTSQAQEELYKKVEKEHGDDMAQKIRKLEQSGIEDLERRAKNILTTVIQRLAQASISEVTTTTVAIPSDELKGKIIGREGRNIRALERAAGVEIIVDDTPGAIVISGFDPVRRHIAKNALEVLIADGRIQPARIEEAVEKAKESIEKQIKDAGEAAAFEIGAFDLDPRLLNLLGRLKFRTSYGQNVLQHSIEMAHLAGMLATELGADIVIAKKGALLHDIGKAVDHEVQGTHVEIGRRILEKFNVDRRIIQAMQSHHEEYPYETVESIIVQTVDAISAGRPGARRDSVENYLKRLQDLETIANSFEGVEKSYAISAGREVRVFVTPDKIGDLEARNLARSIAMRIENELKYPGEIKVHVIREMRAVEFAR